MSKENEKKIDGSDVALASGSLGAIGTSKNMILGKKRMYHGTSKKNWESIKNEGLKASRGGIGGASVAVGSQNYIKNSKGKVHATRVRPLANMYANMNEVDSPIITKGGKLVNNALGYMTDGKISSTDPNYSEFLEARNKILDYQKKNKVNMTKETVTNFFKKPKNGKVLKINMDYDKYKAMELDPDQAGEYVKNFGRIQRNVASRGNINISPEEIAGSSVKIKDRMKHTFKNMPGYIKNNPKRFGGGVALASAGAYGLKKLYDKKKEEKTAFDIVEESFEKLSNTL